jgi:hypothetical protein
MHRSPALKRYTRRVLWLSVIYVLFLFAAVYAFNHHLLHGVGAYVAAVLPALPIIGIFGTMGRYLIDEQDEYVRILTVRQTLWATGFALSVATIWGFLESFDLVGHVDAYYIAVLWFGGLGLGSCMNKLTLGEPVRC